MILEGRGISEQLVNRALVIIGLVAVYVAQDALDMAESVVEATEHLLQLARSCQRLRQR